MTEYRYVIQHPTGECLYLSADAGPQKKPMEFLDELRAEGFKYDSEQSLGGGNMLRVLKRDVHSGTAAGAVVRTDPYTGRKTMS